MIGVNLFSSRSHCQRQARFSRSMSSSMQTDNIIIILQRNWSETVWCLWRPTPYQTKRFILSNNKAISLNGCPVSLCLVFRAKIMIAYTRHTRPLYMRLHNVHPSSKSNEKRSICIQNYTNVWTCWVSSCVYFCHHWKSILLRSHWIWSGSFVVRQLNAMHKPQSTHRHRHKSPHANNK